MKSILFTELTPSEQETLQGGSLLGIVKSDSSSKGKEDNSSKKHGLLGVGVGLQIGLNLG